MKAVTELNLPEQIGYSSAHTWVARQAPYRVGVSDYAQDRLGALIFADLPEVGSEFAKGEEFGALESAKSISSLYMPVSGRIKAVNQNLKDNLHLPNQDCYGQGWLVELDVNNTDEIENLLSSEAYRQQLQEEQG